MQRVRIIALGSDRYPVVSGLHKLGMIDLRKSDLQMSDDVPPQNYTQLSEMLIKVQGALDILGGKAKPTHGKIIQISAIDARFKELEDKIQRTYDLRDELQLISEDNKALLNADYVARCFGSTEINLGGLSSGVLSFMAVVTDDRKLARFREQHGKSGKNSEITINRIGKNSNLVFAAYRKGDEQMEETLKGLGEELDLHAKYLDSTPSSILKSVSAKRAENISMEGKAKKELEKLGVAEHNSFSVLRESLAIELARAEASSSFKRTEKTIAIEGWIPKKRVGELKSFLHKATNNRFVLEETKSEELAPTLVNRPGFLKPFDYLMEFFSMPRSDEIDPTWIFIISFPIFYGIMVSDVGYGIASFILSQIIIMKTDPEGLMCNTAKIWRLSAIPAIIVGVLTDQYFGFPLDKAFASGFQPVSWLGDITWIIILTIAFGILQVCLGFVFGFINEWRHGHKKLAISKITSIIGLLAGTVAVAGLFFHALGTGISIDAAGVAIGAIIVTAPLSGIEAAEITNLITHPLSYARLMGFGLGSIIIAMLIDQAFTPNIHNGILLFVVYGAIFMLLHFMNMILSIFEGIVQAARLNFVEFFSKFYKGGGVKYRPFSYKRVYAEE